MTPDGYDGTSPLPVAVWLHGYGAEPDLLWAPWFQRFADSRQVALVAASATLPLPGSGYSWAEDPALDAARVDRVFAHYADDLTPEPGRIVLFGFSQGAAVAAELASRQPERYAGALLLSPGLAEREPQVASEGPSLAGQGYVGVVGAGEHPGNQRITRVYTGATEARGARVLHRETADQVEHTFPADWQEQLPVWFDFVLQDRGGLPERTPMSELFDAEATEVIDQLIREGYTPEAELVDYVAGWLEIEDPADVARIGALVPGRLDLARQAERSWPAVTDNDRLDRAFAALEAAGVVARQHFEDCGTCGVGAIGDEMERAKAAGLDVRGYVFFHFQDTEGALDGGGLYLSYGPYSGEHVERDGVVIGHEIVAALRAQGLTTDWNASYDRRIGVQIDWKKRRFSEPGGR